LSRRNALCICNTATAKDAWNNLQQALEDAGLTRKVRLFRKITITHLENCDLIEKYVKKIMSAAHQLTAIGFEINQE